MRCMGSLFGVLAMTCAVGIPLTDVTQQRKRRNLVLDAQIQHNPG